MKARVMPYAAVAFAACSWGTWAWILRYVEALRSMPVALESMIVMGVITVVTGAASLRDRVSKRATWKAWAGVGWLGVGDLLNVLLFFAAYKLTIAVAVLTHYLAPILVALSAPLLLREPMTVRTGVAIAASFAGLAVLIAPSGGSSSGSQVWMSAALGTGSAAFYASNVIVNKFVMGSFSTSETMFWHGVVATPLAAMLVPSGAWASVHSQAAAILALASIGPGALAGLAFVWGLRRMPAAHASTLTLLEPLVSIILGARVLGERLGAHAGIGGTLILAGAVGIMVQPGAARARPCNRK